VNWRVKAAVQRAVARLPRRMGDSLYYFLQRRFGGLRNLDPTSRFSRGVEIVERLCKEGLGVSGATAVEVGTGWRINVPIALWLCGVSRIHSVDKNRYLRLGLVLKDCRWLLAHRDLVCELLGDFGDSPAKRLDELDRVLNHDGTQLFDLLGFSYLAPADARSLPLRTDSVDFHFSVTVLEHIPEEVIVPILLEGCRVVRRGGCLVHFVDPSDHYAHSEYAVSRQNFLRFSAAEWHRIAGNRFAYHNRLRVDAYRRILEDLDFDMRQFNFSVPEPRTSERVPLDGEFRGLGKTTLTAEQVRFVAVCREGSGRAGRVPPQA